MPLPWVSDDVAPCRVRSTRRFSVEFVPVGGSNSTQNRGAGLVVGKTFGIAGSAVFLVTRSAARETDAEL